MRHVLLILTAALFLAACSPKYETRYELTPPKTTAGLASIKTCDVKSQQCNAACGRKYDTCSLKAQQEARKTLPALLKDYELELLRWEKRSSDYKRDLMMYRLMHELMRKNRSGCKKKDNDCRRRYYVGLGYPWLQPSSPGSRPVKPTLESVTKKIRDTNCTKDCGCKAQFRQCYSAHGGKVTPHQVCVRNCN